MHVLRLRDQDVPSLSISLSLTIVSLFIEVISVVSKLFILKFRFPEMEGRYNPLDPTDSVTKSENREETSESHDSAQQNNEQGGIFCNDYDRVEPWRKWATSYPPYDLGVAGRLYLASADLYAFILSNERVELTRWNDVFPRLLRGLHILKLWADGNGAENGKLDNTLQTSELLKGTVLQTLISLAQLLLKGMLRWHLDAHVSNTDRVTACCAHHSIHSGSAC
jgi:hypothetical protein